MADGSVFAQSDRVALRRLTLNDADMILDLFNDPDYIRFIRDNGVRDLAGARAYLTDKMLSSYDRYGYGSYCVIDRADGRRAGICGLVRHDGLEFPDIGYGFLAAFRGRGLAIEAARLVVRHAIRDVGLTQLDAITNPDNVRSQGVLFKLGFVRAGTYRAPPDGPELSRFTLKLVADKKALSTTSDLG